MSENWIILNEGLRPAWEREATKCIREITGEEFSVGLTLPTEADVREALANNFTLCGKISFIPDWGAAKEYSIPLPYEGVFVVQGQDTVENRPNLAVWSSYLTDEEPAKKNTKAKPSEVLDRGDLTHRRCLTFPVELLRRFEILARKLLGNKQVDMGNPHDPHEEYDFGTLASALVPLKKLETVRPENLLDLAGRLYGVRRFFFTREKAKHIPAECRQNHKTFAKRLCPIETPESESVGLQLQFARGAIVDTKGKIRCAEDASDGTMLPYLGWGASLVPFLNHDDDARTMMGAKNMRQAVRVRGAEPPAVKSGGEKMLVEATSKLVAAGLCPDGTVNGELALGRDLLVAYIPWYGWNVDDAVVVCEDICDAMSETETKEFATEIDPAWKASGEFAKPGRKLTHGSVIACFEKGRKKHRVSYVDEEPGVLDEISFPKNLVEGESGTLRYKVTRNFPLGPGDKLMGRHGNKGVVAKVLKRCEMPRLADGTVVDILLNPHGVLSRRNPGQILETHVGWLLHNGVKESEILAKGAGASVGAPAMDLVDHAKVRRLLKSNGLDSHGATKLHWKDANGKEHESENPVVVGYQHFFRLHHIPSQKSQARRGGTAAKYSYATGQAAHGRSIGGGQRFGEMETWALAAYPETTPILVELLANANAVATRNGDAGKLGESGFAQTLSDLLTALCIKTEFSEAGVRFSRMSDDEVRGLNAKTISNAQTLSQRSAAFRCPENAKQLAFNGRRFTWHDAKCKSLTLNSLLDSFGCNPSSLIVKPLYRGKHGKEAKSLTVEVSAKEKSHAEFLTVRCWLKVGGKAGGTAGGLFEFFEASEFKDGFGTMHVLCGCAKCVAKTPNEAVKLVAADIRDEASTGGVCDESIFGKTGDAFELRADERWGIIELPAEIDYPLKGVKGVKLNAIPVLPLRYRMPRPFDLDPFGYEDVVSAVDQYGRMKDDEDKSAKAKKALKASVARLFERLSERFCGKHGIVRHDGLGRRVDRSCRLVLRPDPELALDEVGVPTSVLWELVGDHIKNSKVKIEGESVDADLRDRNSGDCEIGWSWRSPEGTKLIPLAKRHAMLERFLEERKSPLRLLVNRQPSLHKYNLQSFRVKVLPPSAGEVFALPPLCFKGFAADCDGDEISGYLPLTDDAQSALAKLSPTENLVSDANGEMLANYDRDFVTGSVLLADGDIDAAKNALMKFAVVGDVDALMKSAREAFAKCTETGVSFGFYDLMDLATADDDGAPSLPKTSAPKTCACSRFVKLLTESGANGAQQLPQILNSLVGGTDWKGVFENSYSARSSMCDKKLCTGKAGDLTRRLVYALRPCTVVTDDCGCKAEKRSVLACRAKGGVCAKCYGTLANGSLAPVGYPAGLLAAQFIGERGTQLSMRSAHAGRRQVDIESVRDLILKLADGRDEEWTRDDFARFDSALCGTEKDPSAYAKLEKRHLQLLWRVMCEDRKSVRPIAKVLKGVDKAHDFESLARVANREALAIMVNEGMGPISLDTPSAQVMFGGEVQQ